MSAATVAVGARSCLVSSCKMNHLGMKPVRGGRPPRDKKIRGARAIRAGAFVQEAARVLMVVVLLSLKTRNVEKVMAMYVSSVSSVREGAICSTRIIQPK